MLLFAALLHCYDNILECSAFAGLAVMIILMPAPALLASLMEGLYTQVVFDLLLTLF